MRRTRVIRSFIWRLERDVVCYRTALEFDTAVDTDAGAPSERSASNDPALSEQRDSKGPALSEQRESNGYPVPAEFPKNEDALGTRYPDAMAERGV